jgi:hypothetical protein
VIEEALKRARCVVVLWSNHSIQSQWVWEEANDGLERGVLIPVLLEEVKPPMGFRSIQAIELFGDEGGISLERLARVCAEVDRLLGVPSSSPVRPRAIENVPDAPGPARQSVIVDIRRISLRCAAIVLITAAVSFALSLSLKSNVADLAGKVERIFGR